MYMYKKMFESSRESNPSPLLNEITNSFRQQNNMSALRTALYNLFICSWIFIFFI